MSRPDAYRQREPLALHGLIPQHELPPLTVADHDHFRRCISTDERGVDALDRGLEDEFDEHLQIDPYSGDPPSKRKDREVARVLSILDSLESSEVRGDG